jgi:peptide methionine sulfoxide reductase MsrA
MSGASRTWSACCPGVESTRIGYTGGDNDHPTYRNHPGHAEAIEITYDDPTQTNYRRARSHRNAFGGFAVRPLGRISH